MAFDSMVVPLPLVPEVEEPVVAPDPRIEDINFPPHAEVNHGTDALKVRDVMVKSLCPEDRLRSYFSYTTGRFVIFCIMDYVTHIMILEAEGSEVTEVTSFTARQEYAARMLLRDAYFEVPFAH